MQKAILTNARVGGELIGNPLRVRRQDNTEFACNNLVNLRLALDWMIVADICRMSMNYKPALWLALKIHTNLMY